MDAIGEVIVMFFSFVFHSMLLVLEAILAIFDPSKRESLRERWKNSLIERLKIITSFLFLITIIIGMIYLFSLFHSCSSHSTNTSKQQTINIENKKTDGEKVEIKIELSDDTKEKLKDKAVDFIKEKWKNRE